MLNQLITLVGEAERIQDLSRCDQNIGTIFPALSRPGMEQPLVYWVPSIGPSGIVMYTGDRFSRWKGNLFVGAPWPAPIYDESCSMGSVSSMKNNCFETCISGSEMFVRVRTVFSTCLLIPTMARCYG
jgi:hypothetical protein